MERVHHPPPLLSCFDWLERDDDPAARRWCGSVTRVRDSGGFVETTLIGMLAALGLFLDIIGAILLWKYGLPESVNRKGHSYWVLEETDEAEIQKARRYDKLSHTGLALLITGFVFQLVSVIISEMQAR